MISMTMMEYSMSLIVSILFILREIGDNIRSRLKLIRVRIMGMRIIVLYGREVLMILRKLKIRFWFKILMNLKIRMNIKRTIKYLQIDLNNKSNKETSIFPLSTAGLSNPISNLQDSNCKNSPWTQIIGVVRKVKKLKTWKTWSKNYLINMVVIGK